MVPAFAGRRGSYDPRSAIDITRGIWVLAALPPIHPPRGTPRAAAFRDQVVRGFRRPVLDDLDDDVAAALAGDLQRQDLTQQRQERSGVLLRLHGEVTHKAVSLVRRTYPCSLMQGLFPAVPATAAAVSPRAKQLALAFSKSA